MLLFTPHINVVRKQLLQWSEISLWNFWLVLLSAMWVWGMLYMWGSNDRGIGMGMFLQEGKKRSKLCWPYSFLGPMGYNQLCYSDIINNQVDLNCCIRAARNTIWLLMCLSLLFSESMMVSVQAFATEMGNRWAVWWICQLEHWQLQLGLLQCKYNFHRFPYSGSESCFLLVYTNLPNSCYLFSSQPEDNPDFYVYPQDVFTQLSECDGENFFLVPPFYFSFPSPFTEIQGVSAAPWENVHFQAKSQGSFHFVMTIKVKSHA